MRIAFAGGGSEQDSAPIDQHFAGWLGPSPRLLYIPVALGWSEQRYADAGAWIRSVFHPLGVESIDMWTTLDGKDPAVVAWYSGIYLGGGNTYRLLHELRRTGLNDAIRRFAEEDRPVYGGSAGAAVLGHDIATVNHMDFNDVGISDTSGLDLASGASLWVHYTDDDRGRADNYLKVHGGSLIALSERSGAVIEDGDIYSVGFEPALTAVEGNWSPMMEHKDRSTSPSD